MKTKTTLSSSRFVSIESDFALKINHTLWLLWELRVNVILLLFICIFYWFTPQGMDILVGLSEPGLFKNFRLLWSFVDLGLFAFFQWYIPRYLFGFSDGSNEELYKRTIIGKLFDYITLRKNPFPKWLSSLVRSPNAPLQSFGQSIQLHKDIKRKVPRALAVFSVLVAPIGMLRIVALNSNDTGLGLRVFSHPIALFIITIVITILAINLFDKWFQKNINRKIKRGILLLQLLSIISLITLAIHPTNFNHATRLVFIGIAQLLWAILICTALTLRKRINTPKIINWFTGTVNFLFSLNLLLVFGLYVYFNLDKSDLTYIYPISVLYISLNFFYLIISFLIALRIKTNFYFLSPILMLLFFSALFNNSYLDLKLHEIEYTNSSHKEERPQLDEYFYKWVINRQEDIEKSNNYPVYIVAGEGGGSRAAFWTNTVLSKLHDETNKEFTEHLFAVSSVSGSSFGAAAHIAFLDKLKTYPNLEAQRIERIEAFAQNYLSSSIASLLGKDFWITCIPYINRLWNVRDRAKRLESEWSCYVEQSFGDDAMNINAKVLDKDYLSFWKDSSYSIPLYFPNTTRVEDGKRGIISPVIIGDECIDAIDVIKNLPKNKSIKMSTAALLSARFPYINPGGKISGLGHFVDGGYYENAAAQTVQAIWNTCKKKIANIPSKDNTLFQKLEFRIILIFNGENTYNSELKGQLSNISQLTIPISSIGNVRSGHTQRSYKLLEREVQNSPKDKVYIFELDHTVNITEGNTISKVMMPLARFLSRRAADGILENFNKTSIFHPKVENNLKNLDKINAEL